MYFEPTNFEEYVSKLAQGLYKPPAEAWFYIENRLQGNKIVQRRISAIKFSIAASITILFSFGAYYFLNLSFIPAQELSQGLINLNEKHLSESLSTNYEPIQDLPKINASQSNQSLSEVELSKINSEKTSIQLLSLRNTTQLIPNIQSHVRFLPTNQNSLYSTKTKINLKKSSSSLWSISTTVAPSYNQLSIKNDITKSESNGTWQFSAEILAKRKINKWLSVQSGLAFNPVGLRTNNVYVIYSTASDKMLETVRAKSPYGNICLKSPHFAITNYDNYLNIIEIPEKNFQHSRAAIEQQLYYIELPMVLSVNASKLGFRNICANVGFAPGVLIGNRFNIYSDIGNIGGKTEVSDKFSYSLQASLEYSYPVSKNFNLLFEPTFKYNLKRIEGTTSGVHPVSFQFKIGASFR